MKIKYLVPIYGNEGNEIFHPDFEQNIVGKTLSDGGLVSGVKRRSDTLLVLVIEKEIPETDILFTIGKTMRDSLAVEYKEYVEFNKPNPDKEIILKGLGFKCL